MRKQESMFVRVNWAAAVLILLVLFCAPLWSQQAKECPAAILQMGDWQRSRIPLFMNDFGELGRYSAANAEIKAPLSGENRIVFFGDSITDKWNLERSFPGKKYMNRGIGGQTTSQMLVRFRQDVINLQPAVIVILAGTNDIAGNSGPIRMEDIKANLANMAELARAHNIRVIFSTVMPVHNYTPESLRFFSQRPMEKIRELNGWLKDYCAATGCTYLDYFSSLLDENGLLKKDLSADGLHPNAAGYAIMSPLAIAAVDKALSIR
jgi:lysophospholipase L1-like esterase